MKSKIAFAVGIFLASFIVASAESYTVTITPGRFCFIANQLNNGGNTLNELFPFTTGHGTGSTIDWFDIGLQSMSAAQFDPDDLVWPDGITLAPGGGALLDYQGPETTLTFTGTQVSSPVLITPVAGKQQWVSDQLPEVGTWDTILAVAPGATAAVGEAWNVYYVAPVPEPAVSALLGLGVLVYFQRFTKNRRS
jgi:hypothetical protein